MAQRLIDQVDEDNNLIGPIGRWEAHDKGLWHRGVGVWLYSPSGKVLLQRRAKSVSEAPGKLDISVAGHVDAGDSVEKTVVKELEEELGIRLSIDQVSQPTIFKYDYPSETSGKPHRRFTYIYLAQIDESTPITFNDGEVEEVVWLGLAEFKQMIQTDEFRDHSDGYMAIVLEQLEQLIGAKE